MSPEERSLAGAGQRTISATGLALAVSLFLAGTANWTVLGLVLEQGGEHAVVMSLTVFCALVLANLLLLELAAAVGLLRPVASALLLLASATAYFVDAFGVFIDESMVVNVFETDQREAWGLMTWPLALRVVLLGVLPCLLLWRLGLRRRSRLSEMGRGAVTLLLVFALTAASLASQYGATSLFVRGHRQLRWQLSPSAPLTATWAYLRHNDAPPETVSPLGLDARIDGARPGPRRLVVLVVGETATAGHFSLNGYERRTNPELEGLDVVNFPDAESCATSTAESLPCMFSASSRSEYSRAAASGVENLLDVLQRAGVSVLWRDNNSGCKGVCERVPFQWVSELHPDPAWISEDGFYDEALLQGLQQLVDSQDGDLFIVLHQEGSHGPSYFKRSPPAFKRFLPECARDDVQNCSREELVNAYDNTILYTDHFLARVIDFVAANSRTSVGVMLYASDHGESLGDDGIYLHGFPRWLAPKEQYQIPMVAWLSPNCDQLLGLQRPLLDAARLAPVSHDNLFHTLLGLFDVTTAVYDSSLDIFGPCRSR